MESSMEFTQQGSMVYKGYKINQQGVQISPDRDGQVSPFMLKDIKLSEVLGRGTSSVVKKGENTLTGEKVAVKILGTVYNPELRKALHSELKLLTKKLQETPSPHIVRVIDVFYLQDEDMMHIVLELCDAGSLDRTIRSAGRAPEAVASVVTRQVFLALGFLFDHGIQHRDIKPSNVLLTREGAVKLSDFGSSKEDITAETFCGTTRYMSPERLNGREYSTKADVWSAGMVMLEMCFGDHPYHVCFGTDGSFVAMIEYATKHDTPRLDDSYSDHARGFACLCLAKRPDDRPPPGMLVKPGNLRGSHPFVAQHAALGNAAVAEWIQLGARGVGPLLSVGT
uniref:mitogen-activated protein kinase kinase n=1 Tax=Hemiselmis tepida TaxID=464990 RepID=A0A7S0Z475_9CRYP